MPDTVPADRVATIRSLNAAVELVKPAELVSRVDNLKAEGYTFVHPFDDVRLMAGYGSCAVEILQQCPEVDVLGV